MGCGGRGKCNSSKENSRPKGKGDKNGGKGGRKGGGMQSQDEGSMSNGQLQKQFGRMDEQLKQVLVGSRPKAGFWTCSEYGEAGVPRLRGFKGELVDQGEPTGEAGGGEQGGAEDRHHGRRMQPRRSRSRSRSFSGVEFRGPDDV